MTFFKKTLSSFAVLAMLSTTSLYAAGEGLTASQISSGAAGTVASVEGGFMVAGTFISTAAATTAGLLTALIAAAAADSNNSHSSHTGHSK